MFVYELSGCGFEAHLFYERQITYTNEDKDKAIECDKKFTKRINHIKLMLEHINVWSRWEKDYILLLQEHVTNYKGRRSQHTSINETVIVYKGKQPRKCQRMSKIVELIESKDKKIRSSKILIGKTQNVTKLINRLHPVEFSEEFNSTIQNEVATNERTKTRRNAALMADLKRKFYQ